MMTVRHRPGWGGDDLAGLAGDGSTPTDRPPSALALIVGLQSASPSAGGGIGPVSGRSAPRHRRPPPNVAPPADSPSPRATSSSPQPRNLSPATRRKSLRTVPSRSTALRARSLHASSLRAPWRRWRSPGRNWPSSPAAMTEQRRSNATTLAPAGSSGHRRLLEGLEISIGPRGIAYSAGTSIYLLSSDKPRLVWRSTGLRSVCRSRADGLPGRLTAGRASSVL